MQRLNAGPMPLPARRNAPLTCAALNSASAGLLLSSASGLTLGIPTTAHAVLSTVDVALSIAHHVEEVLVFLDAISVTTSPGQTHVLVKGP